MTFAERLKELRLRKGFTQEELANKIGVAKSTLTGYEKGNREPDLFKIKKLTQVLEVDANYLLGLSKSSSNNTTQELEHISTERIKEDRKNINNIRENISNNITFYRKKMKLTQEELANKINVKKTSVSSWEHKANSPDIETLYELCKLFNISLEEMYGVSDNNNQETLIEIEKEYIEMAKELEKYNITQEDMKKIIKILKVIKQE